MRGPYTVDDLVGEIISERATREVVLDVLERAEVPAYFKRVLDNERNLPLRQSLRILSNYAEVKKMIDDALDSL